MMRPVMLLGVYLILPIFLFLLIYVQFIVSGERRDYSFPTMDAARKGGLVSKGWIPATLPESIRDIHLQYDTDTKVVCTAFRHNGLTEVDFMDDWRPVSPVVRGQIINRLQSWFCYPELGIPGLEKLELFGKENERKWLVLDGLEGRGYLFWGY